MPRITVKVPSSYEAITRPVADNVVKDVMRATGIDYKKTRVHVMGEFGYAEQPGTKLGGAEDVSFGGNSRIYVTVDDTLRYQSIHNQYVRANENYPILYDDRLGIGMYPVYVESDLMLTFKYIAKSKEEAKKWVDEFAIRRAEERSVLYHEILYYIPIQDGVLNLLSHLHSLREKIAGYGDTFTDYIRLIQQRELTTQTRLDGDLKSANLSVPEKQVMLTGIFDFSEVPKEVKTDGATTWEIEWTYKMLYKRCTHFYLSYPLVVHQSHIAAKYFKKKKLYSLEEVPKYQGLVVTAFDLMDGYYEHFPRLKGGIRYPEHDDWIADHLSQPPNTYPVVTWLLGLDPAQPTKLMSLTNIPEIRFTKEIDAYLRLAHKDLTHRGKAALYVNLFKDGKPVGDNDISVDENLNITSKHPLDLRCMYHLRLSTLTHFNAYSKGAIDLIRANAEAFKQIIATIDSRVDLSKVDNKLVLDKYIPRDVIESIFDVINGVTGYVPNTKSDIVKSTAQKGGKWTNTRFVQNLAIFVKR